jgi:hypothetical protein
MDIETNEILFLSENKVHIHFTNKVLTVELYEDILSSEDTTKMNNILDMFYSNCKKNNIFFYILYDFSQVSISSSSSIICDISIYCDHFNKNTDIFRSNLKCFYIIIQNATLRDLLTSILDSYKPEIKPVFIQDISQLKYI